MIAVYIISLGRPYWPPWSPLLFVLLPLAGPYSSFVFAKAWGLFLCGSGNSWQVVSETTKYSVKRNKVNCASTMRLALATRSWTWMKMMVRDICSKLWSDRTYFLMLVFSYNTYENLYHFLPIFLCTLLYPWDCSIGPFLIWPKCGCSRAKHPSGGGSAQQSLCLPDSTPWELYATTLQGRPRRREGRSMCRNFSIRLEFHLYPHRLQEAS